MTIHNATPSTLPSQLAPTYYDTEKGISEVLDIHKESRRQCLWYLASKDLLTYHTLNTAYNHANDIVCLNKSHITCGGRLKAWKVFYFWQQDELIH